LISGWEWLGTPSRVARVGTSTYCIISPGRWIVSQGELGYLCACLTWGINMKQVEMNMITSPPRKRRKGKKRSGSVSSSEKTRLTWASDCDFDMNFERERGERRTETEDADGDSYGRQLIWSGIP
jgi:hypothetical protein